MTDVRFRPGLLGIDSRDQSRGGRHLKPFLSILLEQSVLPIACNNTKLFNVKLALHNSYSIVGLYLHTTVGARFVQGGPKK